MIYKPDIPLQAILTVIFLTISIPAISFLAEYALRRTISGSNRLISISISIAVGLYLFIQIFSTKIIAHDDKIEFSSISFAESIRFTEITKIDFYQQLPIEYQPDWRMNGIGLFGYLTGKFKTYRDEPIYVQTTTPPYIIITADNRPKILASADQNLYFAFQKNLKTVDIIKKTENKQPDH